MSYFNPPVAIILKQCTVANSVPNKKLMVTRGTSDDDDFDPQGGREQGATLKS